jgi:uncharacterized membrane protein
MSTKKDTRWINILTRNSSKNVCKKEKEKRLEENFKFEASTITYLLIVCFFIAAVISWSQCYKTFTPVIYEFS